MTYIIQTNRLGLRSWKESDKAPFFLMNSDAEVMKHFPSTLNRAQSDELWYWLNKHFADFGYTYFAVDLLDRSEFIGFIGLKKQTYQYKHTPFIDIGWRLSSNHWGKGYATEGASACLEFAFKELQLSDIYGVAVHTNIGSLKVMQKLGMKKIDEFVHPLMAEGHHMQPCHCYHIRKPGL